MIMGLSSYAQSGYKFARHTMIDSFTNKNCTQEESISCDILQLSDRYKLEETIIETIKDTTNSVLKYVSNLALKIPVFILNIFIIIFIVFFLFKDGPRLVEYILKTLSLKTQHKNLIIKQIKDVISAVIYGHFLTAVVQGFVGGLGFFMFGFPSPFLWGLVMIFFSMIPFVGPMVVWVPAAIINIALKIMEGDSTGLIYGILFIFYGFFVISGIDNLIKPKLIGDRADIHPVVIMLGVVGGISIFGVIGLILGPLILSILITFINIYNREKKTWNLK
jgi:predicted PurR-regulated permease PerM